MVEVEGYVLSDVNEDVLATYRLAVRSRDWPAQCGILVALLRLSNRPVGASGRAQAHATALAIIAEHY